uniref:Uncharacterized protein n=1 Tax=Oryza punctata TaxID=4537 RepID=A0A0E0L5U0_ORYPU
MACVYPDQLQVSVFLTFADAISDYHYWSCGNAFDESCVLSLPDYGVVIGGSPGQLHGHHIEGGCTVHDHVHDEAGRHREQLVAYPRWRRGRGIIIIIIFHSAWRHSDGRDVRSHRLHRDGVNGLRRVDERGLHRGGRRGGHCLRRARGISDGGGVVRSRRRRLGANWEASPGLTDDGESDRKPGATSSLNLASDVVTVADRTFFESLRAIELFRLIIPIRLLLAPSDLPPDAACVLWFEP